MSAFCLQRWVGQHGLVLRSEVSSLHPSVDHGKYLRAPPSRCRGLPCLPPAVLRWGTAGQGAGILEGRQALCGAPSKETSRSKWTHSRHAGTKSTSPNLSHKAEEDKAGGAGGGGKLRAIISMCPKEWKFPSFLELAGAPGRGENGPLTHISEKRWFYSVTLLP